MRALCGGGIGDGCGRAVRRNITLHGRRGLRGDDAHMVHEVRDLIHDRGFHRFEHLKCFDLVLDERVALSIGTQVDTLTQHIHVVEVIHPLLIDDAEHDDLLKLAHILLAEHELTVLVALLGKLFEEFLDLVARERFEFFLFQLALRRIDLLRILDECVELPLLGIELLVRVLRHLVLDDVLDHREDVLAQVLPAEDLAPLAVDDLALLIHDVVVFEDVLADVKIARFDFFLRVLHRARDDGVLDRLILLHAELIHDARDAVGGKETHEVVFEREEKFRRAGVALTPGTPAELVVDAPRLVPLRADDEESAKFLDALAELDVRTASRHVRRDRDGTLLPRVCDDLGFFFMEFRVEDDVRDAVFPENVRHLLGLRDGRRADEDGLPRRVDVLHRLPDRAVFRRLRLVDDIRVVDALHGFVRRDDDDGQLVDLEELVLLGLCRARHAREFFIHAEIVLERDARERL